MNFFLSPMENTLACIHPIGPTLKKKKKNHLFFLLFILLFLLCLVMDQPHRAQQASKPSPLRIDLTSVHLNHAIPTIETVINPSSNSIQ
jgi:hypothetical protein